MIPSVKHTFRVSFFCFYFFHYYFQYALVVINTWIQVHATYFYLFTKLTMKMLLLIWFESYYNYTHYKYDIKKMLQVDSLKLVAYVLLFFFLFDFLRVRNYVVGVSNNINWIRFVAWLRWMCLISNSFLFVIWKREMFPASQKCQC